MSANLEIADARSAGYRRPTFRRVISTLELVW